MPHGTEPHDDAQATSRHPNPTTPTTSEAHQVKRVGMSWQTQTDFGPGSLELGRTGAGFRLALRVPVSETAPELEVALDFTPDQWAELVLNAAELMARPPRVLG